MKALFEGGRIADLILVLVALEAIAAALLGRRLAPALALRQVGGTLAAGAALLLALRAALRDEPWTVVAAWLAAAGLAHAADVWQRWRAAPAQT